MIKYIHLQTIYEGKGSKHFLLKYRNIVITTFWRDSVYSGILFGNLRDGLLRQKTLFSFQAGFVRSKKTVNNLFKTESALDRYLTEKRGIRIL
jgi:hypothetical protein